jgi:hypothetical protein
MLLKCLLNKLIWHALQWRPEATHKDLQFMQNRAHGCSAAYSNCELRFGYLDFMTNVIFSYPPPHMVVSELPPRSGPVGVKMVGIRLGVPPVTVCVFRYNWAT